VSLPLHRVYIHCDESGWWWEVETPRSETIYRSDGTFATEAEAQNHASFAIREIQRLAGEVRI
jgi:hypothetical protein